VLVGRFLDSLFGTGPWLLLIFSFLGVGAAVKSLFDMSKEG
jgi:ATP synthase protein I